jgi:type I restriction enzyme S subunit
MTVATKTIPKGYKQTEIGVIPIDWDVQPISRIAKITTGSKNTQDKVDTGLYPFFVRSQVIERINSYSYDGEAILTAGDGVGTGKVFHYINGKFDIHQRVYKISDFSNDINGYYFYLYFSNNFYNRIMQMTAKSSIDSVRMEMIADMQIPLPGKPEQISIATALSDIDVLIQKTESLIEKKKVIKQGTMQELLTGKRRLPGFIGKWKEGLLGDLVSFINGKPYEPYIVSIGKYNVITLDSIDIHGKLKDEHRQANFCHELLKKRDIVMVLSDIAHAKLLGLCDLIPEDGKYVLNQRMGRIRLLDDGDPRYFRLQINAHQDHFRSRGQGTSQKHIYKRDVNDLLIAVPPTKEEQTAIATILSDMDTEIEKLESELTKWRDIKQGMMQTLLTGKIRLIK